MWKNSTCVESQRPGRAKGMLKKEQASRARSSIFRTYYRLLLISRRVVSDSL